MLSDIGRYLGGAVWSRGLELTIPVDPFQPGIFHDSFKHLIAGTVAFTTRSGKTFNQESRLVPIKRKGRKMKKAKATKQHKKRNTQINGFIITWRGK